MIGIIRGGKIFEFNNDLTGLDYSLGWYGSVRDCNTIVITSSSFKIIGLIYNNEFVIRPNLEEQTIYFLYGNTFNKDDLKILSLGAPIDTISHSEFDWIIVRDIFCMTSQKLPKEIDI